MEGPQRREGKGHRRSRSEGTGITLDALQSGFDLQGAAASGHVRTVSLDTSCASQFLQSLQLHDAQAMQGQGLDAKTAALDQQQAMQQYAAASPGFAGTAAVDASWQQLPSDGLTATAGSKRAHSSNGRLSKESLQEGKESLHQHKHSFTPALPAVEEAAAEPSDRDDEDYDYDSDKGLTPRARRSSGSGRGRARRGGYNGRSENELLLLDPKRVKRILANRQSAARSKERRMTYTVQLESKLHSLSTEMEKLTAKMEGLQGESKLLLQARMELEQQVEGMQQQLSQTSSGNQELISELFALQSALGLPQQLPQPDAVAQSAAAAGHSHQQYDMQHSGQYSSSWQYDASYSHPQAGVYPGTGCSYPAAATGPVGGSAGAALVTSRQGSASAAGIPPLPPQHVRSPNLQASPTLQQQTRQQQSHAAGRQSPAMLQAGSSIGRPPSPRIPSPAAAAATTAAGQMPAASTAAAAADMLLLDQFAAGGDDAAMACVDDLDPDMLATLLDDSLDPAAAVVGAVTAGAQQQQQDATQAAVMQQQSQPFPVAADPVAAAAAAAPMPRVGSSAHAGPPFGSPYSAGVQALSHAPLGASPAIGAAAAAAQGPKPGMVQLPVGHSNWSVQSSPGGGGMVGATGARGRGSPAFSDPLGAEGYPDDVSSGSLGGSMTPGTRHPRLSDSSSIAAAGSRQGAAVPPTFWQQQQQHPGFDAGSLAAPPLAVAAVPPAAFNGEPSAGPGTSFGASLTSSQWGAPQIHAARSPADLAIQQQQQLGLAVAPPPPPPPAAALAAVPGSLLQPQSAIDQVNFVMGANPAAKHRFGGAHHRSASAGSMSSLGWTDVDRSWFSSSSSMQQEQLAGAAAAAAAAPAGRLSAPGAYTPVDLPSSADAYRADFCDSRAALQQQQQQGMRQQQQHRRSYSYAGGGYPAATDAAVFARPSSVGDGMMMQQQQQQGMDVHPAALGPAGVPGVPSLDYAAALSGGHAGAAAAAVGADTQALTKPTRIVTTAGTGNAAAAAAAAAGAHMLQPHPLQGGSW